MRRTIAMLAVCCGLVAAAAGQTPNLQTAPPRQPLPPAARKDPTGILRGQVTAADTGAALTRARVAVVESASIRKVTATDAGGRWEITGLPAGRYIITVSRPPYVTTQYGQRLPIVVSVGLSGVPTQGGQTVGRPVELGDGEVLERVDVKLQRCAVIAGRVIDDQGEPAALLNVNAMRLQYFDGRRQLARAGFRARTNDLGEFRLYGLPAGTYYLMTDSVAWKSALPEDEGLSFAATFYPAGTTANTAQAITVRAGQERAAADIRLTATRLARVAGAVVDDDGVPIAAGTVLLWEDTRGLVSSSARSVGSTSIQGGRFTLQNVAPGNYILQAVRASSGTGIDPGQGLLPIAVSGQGLDGLVITLTRGATVTGQIDFDGDAPPPSSASVKVRAEEPSAMPFASAGVSTVAPDWLFELRSVSPGQRVIRVTGLPGDYAVKAVYVDGEDVTDVSRAFVGRETLSSVRVVVSRKATSVSGVVNDEQGKPVRDYSVVLFTTDAEKLGPGSRWRAVARPDQYGRFSVSTLPPGDYVAVAVDALMPGEDEDPEFLAELRDEGTRFTLAAGGQQSLSLKLTRVDR